MTTVDVVIPAYGRWNLTERCLTLLRQQSVPHSVTVVDNGSPDDTATQLRSAFPDVRVIELGANLGFTTACNRGAAEGTGDIVVLLNNDVEPRADFLEQLVRPFDDAGVGTASPLLLQPDGTIDCVGLFADTTLAGFPRLRGRPTIDAESREPVLAGPCGGGGAYRRSAWEQAGGLDEGVQFYGEDLDLALRVAAAGWKAAAAPASVATHLGSATAGHRSSWQRYEGGFSRGFFLRRYRLLGTAAAPRTLATELAVVCGDAVISHDLSALRGRVAGWRSAAGTAPKPRPPMEALDASIGFLESIKLRRASYGR